MQSKKFMMNSPIEFGLRALVLLSQIEDEGMDIDRLLIYDYILTNSGEFNEELPSLHVETPYKYSKLMVKREILKEGVKLFSDQGLIEIKLTEHGIYYKKSDYTVAFLDNMSSKYKAKLLDISKWVIENVYNKNENKIEEEINRKILLYGIEFFRD